MMDHDAVELITAPSGAAPAGWVLTCEHSSERLPEGWTWPEEDLRLLGTHWASDLGIAPFARALAASLGAPAVLSRFTRLLVDPNRPEDSPTIFRAQADGQPVWLNQGLDEAERERRLERFHRPYHRAADAMVGAHPGASVLGLHSYTASYEGQPREVEIGVLYDADEDLGHAWHEALCGQGYDVRLNEPWSGLEGLMYGPQRHATAHRRRSVELELRQDLLLDPGHAARLLRLVSDTARRLAR